MDKAFENCPKECPLEENSKWLAEKACEIMRKLEAENAKLKLQVEKLLGAIEVGSPCPNSVDLPVTEKLCRLTDCKVCWEDALKTIGVKTC